MGVIKNVVKRIREKRAVIVIIVLVFCACFVVLGLFTIISSNGKTGEVVLNGNDAMDDDGAEAVISPDNLNKVDQLTADAIIAYLTQDIGESVLSRKDRLGKYFADGSPVFEYVAENIGWHSRGVEMIKSEARINGAVEWSNLGEDEAITYVSVDVNFISANGSEDFSREMKWFVMFKKIGGIWSAWDIERWGRMPGEQV